MVANFLPNRVKSQFGIIIIILVSFLMYLFTFRGNPGNPSPFDIEFKLNSPGKVFETSQERSRWAIILSLYHNKSFSIDEYASMGTPDIGYIKGHYYSFFPPGMSVIALPFYGLGLLVGHSQLVVYAVPVIFAIGTMILIYRFCKRIGVGESASLLSALSFGFATSAWGYSVTFYVHVLSAFFILLGVYIVTWKKKTLFWLCIAWLIYGILLYLDFPNIFIYLPVAILLSAGAVSVVLKGSVYRIAIRPKYFFAPLVFILAVILYGFYNYVHFGHPFYLSNTIPRVRDLKISDYSVPENYKNPGQSLNSRNLINGLYTFIVSSDRGLLIYAPTALLFVFGLSYFNEKHKTTKLLLVLIPIICLVLYSMFGDPWGGWAFGSRYMIAVMPELLILAGVGLHNLRKIFYIKVIYSQVIIYSSAVGLIAALTTNVVPPSVEAEPLGLDSNYVVNWKMIYENKLNSFFYNYVVLKSIPALYYYLAILLIISIVFLILVWKPNFTKERSK